MNNRSDTGAVATDAVVLSIVVPTLNEADTIASALAPLQALRERGVEVILADGGSSDGTVAKVQGGVDRIVSSMAGRAVQMNAGASLAQGSYVLFLHADTQLPLCFSGDISHWYRQSITWGFFPVKLSGSQWLLRTVERAMNWRSCFTSVATGDQCLFVCRRVFQQIDGFPTIKLMEDIAISKQLRRIARPYIETEPVLTSSRRWESRGICKTILLMWALRLAYFLGVNPGRLVKWYYPHRSANEL